MQFWDAFNYKMGKAEAADSWLDIPELKVSIVTKIIEAAKKEAAGRAELQAQGRTPKMAQGWLTARRWEDEGQQELLPAGVVADPKKAEQLRKTREAYGL